VNLADTIACPRSSGCRGEPSGIELRGSGVEGVRSPERQQAVAEGLQQYGHPAHVPASRFAACIAAEVDSPITRRSAGELGPASDIALVFQCVAPNLRAWCLCTVVALLTSFTASPSQQRSASLQRVHDF